MEVEGSSLCPRRRSRLGDPFSISSKRTRFAPLPRELVFDDNDGGDDLDYSEDDGRQTERRRRQIVFDEYGVGHDFGYPDDGEDYDGEDDAAAADRRDEWEQQIERQIEEYDPFAVYGGGEAVQGQQDAEQPRQGGGGDEAQQRGRPGQEDSDDDDEILIAQLPRPRIVLRPGPAAAPSPPVEDDGDDERPIRFSRTVVRRPGPTAPAQAAAAAAPPQPSSSSSDSSSSVIRDATVENNGAIDCVICFLPLKPPIFQCSVGHVVCSRCSERQGQASKCHECRAPTPGGYTRCHDMDKVVDSIRVPCPHAAHGCAARPPYHARDAHALSCPHAPCHCPGCAFAGSPAALADHLALTGAGAAHNWPCTALDGGSGGTNVFLRDGFNFILTKDKFLFLLDVRKAPPFGRAVAAFCVHPDRAATATLKLTHRGHPGMHDMCEMFLQSSEFKVACTDLADGVPDASSSNCFQFVVPGSVRDEDDGGASTRVIVEITPPRPST